MFFSQYLPSVQAPQFFPHFVQPHCKPSQVSAHAFSVTANSTGLDNEDRHPSEILTATSCTPTPSEMCPDVCGPMDVPLLMNSLM